MDFTQDLDNNNIDELMCTLEDQQDYINYRNIIRGLSCSTMNSYIRELTKIVDAYTEKNVYLNTFKTHGVDYPTYALFCKASCKDVLEHGSSIRFPKLENYKSVYNDQIIQALEDSDTLWQKAIKFFTGILEWITKKFNEVVAYLRKLYQNYQAYRLQRKDAADNAILEKVFNGAIGVQIPKYVDLKELFDFLNTTAADIITETINKGIGSLASGPVDSTVINKVLTDLSSKEKIVKDFVDLRVKNKSEIRSSTWDKNTTWIQWGYNLNTWKALVDTNKNIATFDAGLTNTARAAENTVRSFKKYDRKDQQGYQTAAEFKGLEDIATRLHKLAMTLSNMILEYNTTCIGIFTLVDKQSKKR